MIYTVTFNPAIDYVIHMDQLITGEVNRTTRDEIYCGGKGINVSTVLKTLEVESTALGFSAGFTGRALLDGLRKSGVNADFIELENGLTRINVKIKADSETDINGVGPDINNAALDKLFEKLDRIQSGDYLCLAGSIPKSLPDDIYETIMKRLSGKKIRIVVDATGSLLKNVLKYKPFLIKPNNHELEEIFETEINGEDEIRKYGEKLQQAGAENVLISMAGDGAMLLTQNDEYFRIGVPRGKVKNSVGAGDSMVAGFLAGYIGTKSFEYALKTGTAAGSATAFSDGLADKSTFTELLKNLI